MGRHQRCYEIPVAALIRWLQTNHPVPPERRRPPDDLPDHRGTLRWKWLGGQTGGATNSKGG